MAPPNPYRQDNWFTNQVENIYDRRPDLRRTVTQPATQPGYSAPTPAGSYNPATPQPSSAPSPWDAFRDQRRQEYDAAQGYFNTFSPEDQANIRATWTTPYGISSPGGSVTGSIAPEKAQNLFMRDWYRNALNAGAVPQPTPASSVLPNVLAPLQSPNTGGSSRTTANPLAALMQSVSAAPTETYDSMKAKYGVQAARDWERNQGR